MSSSIMSKLGKKRRTRTKVYAPLVLLLALSLILFIPSLSSAEGYVIIIDNNVDADSDEDTTANIGNDGTTSYTDAQSLDGSDQEINESSSGGGGGTVIEDYVDLDTSDLDSVPDLGDLADFSNMKISNDVYANLSEASASGEITVTDAVVEDFNTPTATSHTLSLSAASTGDLRVIIIAANPDGTGTIPSINLPSGWSWGGTQTAHGAASDGILGAIYRVVQGGDASTLATTYTQTCMVASICITYEGIDTTTPLDVAVPTYDTTENPPTSPTITTVTDNAWVIRATLIDGAPGFSDSDIPSGTTLRGTMVNNPPSNGQNLGVADEIQVTAGNAGSANWGSGAGSEEAVSLTIAIRPATGSSDYQMDQEVQFTNVIDYLTTEKLCIEAGSFGGSENINVTYWTGSAWSSIASDLTASQWNNYTVSLTSSTFTIKFGGSTTSSDSTFDYWMIDAVLLAVSGEGDTDDVIDSDASDIDTAPDNGTLSGFANLASDDASYATFTETAGSDGYVISVQNLSVDIAGTGTSNSGSLTESQNISNTIPFMSMYIEDSATQSQHMSADCFLSGSNVYVQRNAGIASGGIQTFIYLVEFNSDNVKVQIGNFAMTASGTASVDITAVDLDKSFLLFYYNQTDTTTAPNSRFIRGSFTDTDTVNFFRDGSAGNVAGTFYVVEALGTEFAVQGFTWVHSTAGEVTQTISSVNMSRTMVVGSHNADTTNALYYDESSIAVYLSTVTTLASRKSYAGSNGDVTGFAIEFDADTYVQRISDTTMTGETDDTDISNAVDTEKSIVWCGQLMGYGGITDTYAGSVFVGITGEHYFLDSDTIRYHSNDADAHQYHYSQAIEFTVAVGGTEYILDQELSFTNVPIGLDGATLTINTGTTDAENIIPQIWNTTESDWDNLDTDLDASSWNNYTVTDYVASSMYIQFIDGTKTSDTSTQDVWLIDYIALNLYNTAGTNYRLVWEHQVQSLDIHKDRYVITIYAHSTSDTEEFDIEVWDNGGSDWSSPLTLSINETEMWYNQSVDSSYVDTASETLTWRYVDTIQSSDTTEDRLSIDYAGVRAYNISIYGLPDNHDSLSFSPDDEYHALADSPFLIVVESGEIYDLQIKGVDGTGSPVSGGYLYWNTVDNTGTATLLTTSWVNLVTSQPIGNNTHNIYLWVNYNWVGGDSPIEDITPTYTLNITISGM